MPPFTAVIVSYNGHQDLLPYCLISTYKHLPETEEILVIWDDYVRERQIDFDAIRKKTQVPFRVVYHSDFQSWPQRIAAWGWIRQQLIKLQCHRFTSTRYNFVIDGDVILTGDPILFDADTPILRVDRSRPVAESYKFFGEKYLGIRSWNDSTFVGSTGLLDQEVCVIMERICQHHSGKDLTSAVAHMLELEPHLSLPFSEFEYYGHLAKSQGMTPQVANWNHVPHDLNVHLPIQIMWHIGFGKYCIQKTDFDPDILECRFNRLMQHQSPDY